MEENLSTFDCPYCGKPIGICTVTYTSKAQSLIDKIREATKKWSNDLEVVQDDQTITITPKGYLGKDIWFEINDALKPFDGEYVSAGKESRWVIKTGE